MRVLVIILIAVVSAYFGALVNATERLPTAPKMNATNHPSANNQFEELLKESGKPPPEPTPWSDSAVQERLRRLAADNDSRVAIEILFAPLFVNDSVDPYGDLKGRKTYDVGRFKLVTFNSYPVELRGPEVTLRFPRASSIENNYRELGVGFAKILRGRGQQIYIANHGPGAICCSNFWIVDISGRRPRLIFRSEDFGEFREGMEVFDSERDGNLELVQFDIAFRYMNDDCGTCTPLPRAVFKYDRRARRFLPAPGVRDPSKRREMRNELDYLKANFDVRGNPQIWLQYRRLGRAYMAGLFYEGRENAAWRALRFYLGQDGGISAICREFRRRLAWSKYFRAIKRGRIERG